MNTHGIHTLKFFIIHIFVSYYRIVHDGTDPIKFLDQPLEIEYHHY